MDTLPTSTRTIHSRQHTYEGRPARVRKSGRYLSIWTLHEGLWKLEREGYQKHVQPRGSRMGLRGPNGWCNRYYDSLIEQGKLAVVG